MDEAGQKNPVIKVESAYPSCPCHSPTSFAEIEEEFELDVWPSQGESLGSGTHFKRIKSFLRTALEKTQREAESKGYERALLHMSKINDPVGIWEKGYQAGATAMKDKAVEMVGITRPIRCGKCDGGKNLEHTFVCLLRSSLLTALSALPITDKEI